MSLKLRYITCSDPREHNSIKSIIELAHLPHAEIAVQCHPSKMSYGMPRNIWFNDLLKVAQYDNRVHLAIHVNAEWARDICVNGVIPEIILNWLTLERTQYKPLIGRMQINMPQDVANNINIDALCGIIRDFRHTEIIFQYNDKTKHGIRKLHNAGADFSTLFDASGGNGISPEKWEKPIYAEHPCGYSGGISPTNVMRELNKINLVAGGNEIWIDAEGKLKSPTLFDEKALHDIELAKAYVRRANLWQKAA